MDTQTLTTWTVFDWRAEYERHVNALHTNPRTRSGKLQHIRVFSEWYQREFGVPFHPGRLTQHALQTYAKHSQELERVKAATWNIRVWALNAFAEWIGQPDLMAGITYIDDQSASEAHRSLTKQEYHRLMEQLEFNVRGSKPGTLQQYNAIRNRASITIMIMAGLRVEEVARLDLTDLEMGARKGTITVRRGKREKRRKFGLVHIAHAAIRDWVNIRGNTPTTALFVGQKTGKRLTTRTLQRGVEDMRLPCDIPDLKCHDLRFTFAKRLEQGGVPLHDISRLLGHDSLDMSIRYLRSSLDDLTDAMEQAIG